jgi:hypothetical protein
MSAGIGNEAGNSRSKMLEKRMRASVRLQCPVLYGPGDCLPGDCVCTVDGVNGGDETKLTVHADCGEVWGWSFT